MDDCIERKAQALGVEPSRLRELAEADKDGRVVVLPCKVGERWTDEDGRAVRIIGIISVATIPALRPSGRRGERHDQKTRKEGRVL